jgi:lipoprotein NlpD
MDFRRRKILFLFVLMAFALPHCSSSKTASKASYPKFSKNRSSKKNDSQLAKKVGKDFFIWPLEGPINSPYGDRHGRMHDGVDIGGEAGDPVVAAAGGEVVYSDKLGGYGNLIVLKHKNGLFTAYWHNKKNEVKKGKNVKQGQKIAKVGRTGDATGNHLHFEIRDENGTHDPLEFLPREMYSRK